MTNRRNQRGEISVGLAVVLGVVGLVVLVVGGYLIQYYTADARGAVDQREKTRADGNYRIAAYDKFFDQCSAIQAKELTIDGLDAREVSPEFTQGMKDAAITAQQNTRISLITQYNADAAKEDTRGHFQSSNLPYTIPAELYDPKVGNKTQCAA